MTRKNSTIPEIKEGWDEKIGNAIVITFFVIFGLIVLFFLVLAVLKGDASLILVPFIGSGE